MINHKIIEIYIKQIFIIFIWRYQLLYFFVVKCEFALPKVEISKSLFDKLDNIQTDM